MFACLSMNLNMYYVMSMHVSCLYEYKRDVVLSGGRKGSFGFEKKILAESK